MFSTEKTLRIHIASIHEGQKQFKCEFCIYTCSQKVHLKKHIASIHEGEKPFKCKFATIVVLGKVT